MPPGPGRRFSWCVGLAIAGVSGCGPGNRSPGDDRSNSSPEPADSLAISGSSGLQIWFTLARPAKAADGAACVERGLEIRREGKRIQVPLLYTGETPMLLNDSTMRAMLWTNCRPVDAYLVDLRSGRPTRERQREKS
jgi:hypothetical protein